VGLTNKKILKRLVAFVNNDLLNLYLNYTYKKQIKMKLKKTDFIDSNYKRHIKEYWNRYNLRINLDWHKWYYSRNGIKDVRYIPEYIYYCYIESYFNRATLNEAYSDKAIHNILFSDIKRPTTIAKNVGGVFYDDKFDLISLDEIIDHYNKKKKIVIKPTIESGGGRNICFIDNEEIADTHCELIRIITEFKQDFIIQEVIDQHPELKVINPQSVNTIRVMSIFLNGKVHIISPRLRMGVNGSKVDNVSVGGLSCGIMEDGRLRKYAFDTFGICFEKHPQGFVFEGKRVPSYDKIVNIIKKEHIKFGHFKLISWDFAVDINAEPILIEINLRFQGINGGQLCNGPLFGDLTDEILREVFTNKCNVKVPLTKEVSSRI
jgi:hypothetical protein